MDNTLSLRALHARDWCLGNGLVMFTEPPATPHVHNVLTSNPADAAIPVRACHVPVTLQPTPFPKRLFDDVVHIQPIWNDLVDQAARDRDYLIQQLRETAHADPFTGKLIEIYEKVDPHQARSVGIFRSDYMLHKDPTDANAAPKIAQVEINTISSAFPALSPLVHALHEHLDAMTVPPVRRQHHPVSASVDSAADCLLQAWKQFNDDKSIILFVVQDKERNIIDQRRLEFAIRTKSGYRVPVIRATFSDLNTRSRLDESNNVFYFDDQAVGVVYFRAGYTPVDYPTDQEWESRLRIERSAAFKCPSIGYHLVGTKKMQQVLSTDSALQRYVPAAQDRADLLECCMGLFALDDPASAGVIARAIEFPELYVLKPQREGGGNLIFGDHMRDMLKDLSDTDRASYTLMERIYTPARETSMMRNGHVVVGPAVSELGIYGFVISDGPRVLLNRPGGHLLRTKLSKDEDGGVAAGVAVLDTVDLDASL